MRFCVLTSRPVYSPTISEELSSDDDDLIYDESLHEHSEQAELVFDESTQESSEHAESQINSEPEKSESEAEASMPEYPPGVPVLPDLNKTVLEPLPFDVESHRDRKLEVSANGSAADNSLLNAIAALDEETYLPLTKSSQGLVINGYVIYTTIASYMGPSRILVQSPDGKTSELLQSTRAVSTIALEGRSSLAIEIVDYCHFEGHGGSYYLLDLKTGELAVSDYGNSAVGYSLDHILYGGKHYMTEHSNEASHLGEAFDLYLQRDDGEFNLIVEYATAWDFYEGFLYFTGKERNTVWRLDPATLEKSVFYTIKQLPEPGEYDGSLYSIKMLPKGIMYGVGRSICIENLENGEIQETREDIQFFDDGGWYSSADRILSYTTFDGKTTPLLANDDGQLFAASEGRLFFSRYHGGYANNRYTTWSIDLNGENLTRLDNLPAERE